MRSSVKFAPFALFVLYGSALLSCADPPGRLTMVTYNAGLARGYVDYAAERLAPVAAAIAATDADVMCLQEVWLVDNAGTPSEEQITTIINAARSRFPHNFYQVTRPNPAGARCNETETGPLQTCLATHCGSTPPGELASCALAPGHCGTEWNALSAMCQGCIISNLGMPTAQIISTCVGPGAMGSGYSYSGHNGLLILSKYPIVSTGIREFESALVYRSALHVRVDVPRMPGGVDVYCTHLAADLSASAMYPGTMSYRSFAEENAGQIARLIDYANTSAPSGRSVVAGDMNTGPAGPMLTAELPANYPMFAAAMYDNVTEMLGGRCTFCDSNSLTGPGTADVWIDHVFVNRSSRLRPVSVERLFDSTQSINTSMGAMTHHLSDHYGIRVVLEQQ